MILRCAEGGLAGPDVQFIVGYMLLFIQTLTSSQCSSCWSIKHVAEAEAILFSHSFVVTLPQHVHSQQFDIAVPHGWLQRDPACSSMLSIVATTSGIAGVQLFVFASCLISYIALLPVAFMNPIYKSTFYIWPSFRRFSLCFRNTASFVSSRGVDDVLLTYRVNLFEDKVQKAA